jgi:hypothetical protein
MHLLYGIAYDRLILKSKLNSLGCECCSRTVVGIWVHFIHIQSRLAPDMACERTSKIFKSLFPFSVFSSVCGALEIGNFGHVHPPPRRLTALLGQTGTISREAEKAGPRVEKFMTCDDMMRNMMLKRGPCTILALSR